MHTCTRIHARIPNGHPREEKRASDKSPRTSRRAERAERGAQAAPTSARGSSESKSVSVSVSVSWNLKLNCAFTLGRKSLNMWLKTLLATLFNGSVTLATCGAIRRATCVTECAFTTHLLAIGCSTSSMYIVDLRLNV